MGPMVYYVMIVMVNVLVNPMSLDTNVSNVLLVIGIFLHVQVCEKYCFKLWNVKSNSLTLPECACNKDGSIDSTCDITSGHCSCIDNVGGDKCDTCHNGWYDFPSCQGELYYKISCKLILLLLEISVECGCDTVGSTEISCTNDGGHCTCKTGYAGTKCNECAYGWYMYNGECNGKFPLFNIWW